MDHIAEQYLHHTILDHHRDGEWKKILKLRKNMRFEEFLKKYLWVWPDEVNIHFVKETIQMFNKTGIISIGCGCGLLEAILYQATGIPVLGYEVNKEWWTSKYSAPKFIKLNYIEMPPKEDDLDPDCALLFCYFNDGKAFLDYIKSYKGNLVIIIGPGNGLQKYTDPMPFSANFGNLHWKLFAWQEINNSKDFIAVYTKSDIPNL